MKIKNKIVETYTMIVWAILCGWASAFQFMSPSLTLDVLTINTPSTYTFSIFRSYNDLLSITPWDTQLVPATSSISILFPPQYQALSEVGSPIQCIMVMINDGIVTDPFTCSQTGSPGSLSILIEGAISTQLAINNATIIISNVLNPSPALTTNGFVIQLGNDRSTNGTTITLESAEFESCLIQFDPKTVNTTGSMIINLQLKNNIPEDGVVQIKFPPTLQWIRDISTNNLIPINTATCSVIDDGNGGALVESASCIGLNSQQTVTVSFTFSSTAPNSFLSGSISLQIAGIFSPPTTQPIDIISITSKTVDGFEIDKCQSMVSNLQPQLMTVTIVPTSSPFYINTFGGLVVNFILADTIDRTDSFQLYFPDGSVVSYVFKTSSLLLNALTVYNASANTLTFTQSSSNGLNFKNEVEFIRFLQYRAPPSARPTEQFRFVVKSNTNYEKMQGFATIQALHRTISMVVTPVSRLVNDITNYTISCTLADPLNSNGMIIIIIPSQLSLKDGVLNACPILTSSASLVQNPSCSITVGSNTEITLTNLNATSSTIAAQNYNIELIDVVNHYAAEQITGYEINFYYTEDEIDLVADSVGSGVTMTPGTATINSLALSNQITNAGPVQYTITASLPNGVPTINGFIEIQLSDIVILKQINTATLSFGNPITTHTVTASIIANRSSLSLSLQNLLIPMGSQIQIVLQNITNPQYTAPIQVSIQTKISNGSLVDRSVATPFNHLNPMGFTSISVSRASEQNNAQTEYTFMISLNVEESKYEPNSIISIDFPTQIQILNLECRDSQGQTVRCSLNGLTNVKVQLDDLSINQTSEDYISWQFSIRSVINPISYQPSSPFDFYMETDLGYVYAEDIGNVIITNVQPAPFVSLTWTFQPMIYGGQRTNLNVNVEFLTSEIGLITLDVGNYSVQANGANMVCNSPDIALSCSFSDGLISIVPLLATINDTSLNFSVNSLFLTPDGPLNQSIPVLAYDQSQVYLIHSSQPGGLLFLTSCVIECETCSDDQPSICLTCYSNPAISPFLYFYVDFCYSECPITTFHNLTITDHLQCSDCDENCYECVNQPDYCLSCPNNTYLYSQENATHNFSTCVSPCPETLFANETSQLCEPCISPCFTCQLSSDNCLECLSQFFAHTNITTLNFECLVECPQDETVEATDANNTRICQYCISPCLTCSVFSQNCTSCQNGFYLLFNQTTLTFSCQVQCPQTHLSLDNITCEPCQSPCYSCETALDICLTCIPLHYHSSLNYSQCVEGCQFLSFPNDTANQPYCQLCSTIPQLNCLNCSSQTTCYQCDDPTKSDYVYFPSNQTCLADVPSGYVNISGIAQQCSDNCSQCDVATDNCTLCVGIFNYFKNETTDQGFCLQICPSTYTGISNVCEKCISPCQECETAVDSCITCLNNFFQSQGQCISPEDCPDFTYPNQTTGICETCVSPCQLCQNSTFCQTCLLNLSLSIQSGGCVSQCPSGEISLTQTVTSPEGIDIDTQICRQCFSPCQTCVDTRVKCLSCITNYYHYVEVFRCFEICPQEITVPQEATVNTSRLCVQCQFPCRTCQNNTQTCLSCDEGHYLQVFAPICVPQCSDGYYGSLGYCYACTLPCITCSSDTYCLSCESGLYLDGGNCVENCPSSRGVIINNTCSTCPIGCTRCTQALTLQSSQCSACTASYMYYDQSCLSECPSSLNMYLNESDNRYYCLTDDQLARIGLAQSLSFSQMLPLPFTILGLFSCIASFMSRLQNKSTYLIGLVYCWWGVLQIASFMYLIIAVYSKTDQQGNNISEYKPNIGSAATITIVIAFILNLIALVTQTPYLYQDTKFVEWLSQNENKVANNNNDNSMTGLQQRIRANDDHDQQGDDQKDKECCSNKCSFTFVSFLSLLTSFKLKLILFTKMFRFRALSAQLESVQKFNIFNVFSFIGIIYEGVVMYIVYSIVKGVTYDQNRILFLACVDVIIITVVCFILALLSTKKDKDFFDDVNDQSTVSDNDDISSNHKLDENQTKKNEGLNSDLKGADTHSRLRPKQVGNYQQKFGTGDQEISLNVSEDQNPVYAVNHNVQSPSRVNKVTSSNWVEKEKGFDAYDHSDQDSVKSEKTDRKPVAKTHNKIITSTNSPLPSILKNSPKKQSNISRKKKIKQWVEVDEKNRRQKYENILYKKNSGLERPPSEIKEKNQKQIANTNTKQIVSKSPIIMNVQQKPKERRDMEIQEEGIVEEQIRLESGKNKTFNGGISDNAILMKQSNEKSFQQILPFVHRDGALVYQTSTSKKNKNIFEKEDDEDQENSPKKSSDINDIEEVHFDRPNIHQNQQKAHPKQQIHPIKETKRKMETGIGTDPITNNYRTGSELRQPYRPIAQSGFRQHQRPTAVVTINPQRFSNTNKSPFKSNYNNNAAQKQNNYLKVTKTPMPMEKQQRRQDDEELEQVQLTENKTSSNIENMNENQGQNVLINPQNSKQKRDSEGNKEQTSMNKKKSNKMNETNKSKEKIEQNEQFDQQNEGLDEQNERLKGEQEQWLREKMDENDEVYNMQRPVQRSQRRRGSNKQKVYRSNKNIKQIELNDQQLLQQKIKQKANMLTQLRKNADRHRSNSKQKMANKKKRKTSASFFTKPQQKGQKQEGVKFESTPPKNQKPIGKLVRRSPVTPKQGQKNNQFKDGEQNIKREGEYEKILQGNITEKSYHQQSQQQENRDQVKGEQKQNDSIKQQKQQGSQIKGENEQSRKQNRSKKDEKDDEIHNTDNENNDHVYNSGLNQAKHISSEIFANPPNFSFDKKYSRDKHPMISFDQSSLRKSHLQQSMEKLSNPFDTQKSRRYQGGSDHSLGEINSSQQQVNEGEENQILMSPGNRNSPLCQDDTVPIDNVKIQNRFYNPITEENSQLQEVSENDVTKKAFDYETDNQMFEDDKNEEKRQQKTQSQKQSHNEGDRMQADIVNILQRDKNSVPRQTRRKKLMPQDDKDQKLNLKDFYKKKQSPIQGEQILARKSALESPLKRIPSRERKYEGESGSDDQQKIKQQKQPNRNKLSRITGGDKMSNDIKAFPPKIKSSMEMHTKERMDPKQMMRGNNMSSQAELVKWKQEFAFKDQSHYEYPDQEMDMPDKPKIIPDGSNSGRRSRNKSRSGKEFSYEEVNKSYHKGKLYDYEESSHAYKQSTSRSGSKNKSKRSRYGDSKSPKTSLERIYMQKFQRK